MWKKMWMEWKKGKREKDLGLGERKEKGSWDLEKVRRSGSS
jgi:hypothetical protein